MTKAQLQKKSRTMRKRIRKTLGTLLLVSAIVVAAIPTEGLQAQTQETLRVTVPQSESNIPFVKATEEVYTTGDGVYQFAYVFPKGMDSGNKIAVILGYTPSYLSQDNNLVIPDTVDAYSKFKDNYGSTKGYVAVGKSGNFLYYKEEVPVLNDDGTIKYEKVEVEVEVLDEFGQPTYDDNGDPITKIEEVFRPITEIKIYPCLYNDYDKWMNLSLDGFYTKINQDDDVTSTDPKDYKLTNTSDLQRITGANVEYIGNQVLTANDNGWSAGAWITSELIASGDAKGVFAYNGNIVNLSVGNFLKGIGDYAFYECTGLKSITLSNALDTIGNYAFAKCLNIQQVSLNLNSNLRYIGDHAFADCQGLKSFRTPISVSRIGDYAFQNCYSLEEIDLCGEGSNVALNTLGNHLFVNCRSLKSVRLPDSVTTDESYTPSRIIDISMFEGCRSLQSLTVINDKADIVAKQNSVNNPGQPYTLEDFKNTVPQEFYFEGLDESKVHELAINNRDGIPFAFRYLNEDSYEMVIKENGKKATYRVNSLNQLIYCDIENGMEKIEMPTNIGPYRINEIDSTSFQNNCFLKKITIPASVTKIAANAFKGCHNLKDVIFQDATNLQSIGDKAFATQDVSLHKDGCSDRDLPQNPTLTFTGPVSYQSQPFLYAMDAKSNINVGSQNRTYITYYSGWPTNLTIQYNPETDSNELVDYPIFDDLAKYTLSSFPYMKEEYVAAAQNAVTAYKAGNMTDYEKEIIDSALNIVLPNGIESLQEGLFIDKERLDEKYDVKKSITTNGIRNILPESFEGCINLDTVYIYGETESIGDYAFKDCTNLQNVEISASVTSLGIRPFDSCENLTYVSFQGGDNFLCEGSIIYGLSAGEKISVVQCLETRGLKNGSSTIEPGEMKGVQLISPEAFMDCEGIGSIDFKESSIGEVSERSFMNTKNLYSVYLPHTARTISPDAFKNSNLRYIEIPRNVTYIDPSSFNTDKNTPSTDEDPARTEYYVISFYCEDDSNAAIYASNHGNINTSTKPVEIYYTVYFWGMDNLILDTQTVLAGQDAVPPEPPVIEGYDFKGWTPDYKAVNRDLDIVAQYQLRDPELDKLTVQFVDFDDTVIKEMKVAPGADAEPPLDPVREGYMFIGWRPAFTNITEDTVVYAQYEKMDSEETKLIARFIDFNDNVLSTQRVNMGDMAIEPKSPVRQGYVFTGWRPSITTITQDTDYYATYEPASASNGGLNGGANGGNNGGNGSISQFYTLTVRNGSGSGSYVANERVIVIANDAPAGQVFSHWTVDPGNVSIANKDVTATVIDMPQSNVTVTANYKVAPGSGSNNGGTGGNNAGLNNGTTSGNITTGANSGTTVVINKNGLSNTGVVSVKINGSSDNFVVKVSESSAAAEEVVKALMKEYSDLSEISYFPMDISLYDSTGTKKITDTSGLSISITLPLPDSMIKYAGNNKVASVLNERLDKMTAKFTTISGVPCITFTAEHFSPYVIYVDKSNLTAGVIQDQTPQTGDGIHPKWFLSFGLLALSMVLFLKKEEKVKLVRA